MRIAALHPMEWHHRLLKIQSQSWFFSYKDFFCQQLGRQQSVESIFQELMVLDPQLRKRFEFPLRIPELPFSFHWILFGAPDYPAGLYQMEDPPLLLTLYGKPCWQDRPALSVVGSRKPLRESQSWIEEELGEFTQRHQPLLVSGGARGVDQLVHALAIRKNTPTLVYLPSGLAAVYPQGLQDWIENIVQCGGGLLSEYSLDQRVDRFLFHHRNRLIAATGLATVIVQAAEKSGTLMTAHLASAGGRPVWVLPGHPLQEAFRGNLQLLREGATLLQYAEDLGEYFLAELPRDSRFLSYLEVNRVFVN